MKVFLFCLIATGLFFTRPPAAAQPGKELSPAAAFLFNVGAYGPACMEYSKLIKNDKRNDALYAQRARCHIMKSGAINGITWKIGDTNDDFKEAADDAEKALKLNPNNVEALIVRGLVQSYSGHEPAAVADYTRVIELEPGNMKGFYNRAASKVKLGDMAGAIEDYTRFISLAPQNPAPYRLRAKIYISQNRNEDALADYTSALKIRQNDAGFYYDRGSLLSKMGRCTDAVADFSQAISLSHNGVAAYYDARRLCYAELQQTEQATADQNIINKLQAAPKPRVGGD